MLKTLEDVRILVEEEYKLIFEIDDINIPYAKILRDVMFTKVPTMAINEIRVLKNTSSIPYELIAQRIELIPIKADSNKFMYYDGIEHKEDDTIRFDLHKSADNGVIARHILTNVLSGDMKWVPEHDQLELLKDNPPSPVDDQYVIIKLLPTQEIHMICYAIKGTGEYHTKFSPISNLTYVKSNEQRSQLTIDQLSTYPFLTRKMQTGEITINDLSIFYPKMSLRFTMETLGKIPPLQILEMALPIVNQLMDTPHRERKPLMGYLY